MEKGTVNLEDLENGTGTLTLPMSISDVGENINFNITHSGPQIFQTIQGFQDDNVVNLAVPIQILQMQQDVPVSSYAFSSAPNSITNVQQISGPSIQLQIDRERIGKNNQLIIDKKDDGSFIQTNMARIIPSNTNLDNNGEVYVQYSLDDKQLSSLYTDSSNINLRGLQTVCFKKKQSIANNVLATGDMEISEQDLSMCVQVDDSVLNLSHFGGGKKMNSEIFFTTSDFNQIDEKGKKVQYITPDSNHLQNVPVSFKKKLVNNSTGADNLESDEDEIPMCVQVNDSVLNLSNFEGKKITSDSFLSTIEERGRKVQFITPDSSHTFMADSCEADKNADEILVDDRDFLPGQLMVTHLVDKEDDDVMPDNRVITINRDNNNRTYYEDIEAEDMASVGPGPYKCNLCDEMFERYQGLKKHEKKHIQEKPYPCTECDESFNHEKNLNLHLSIHGNNLTCPQCKKSFKRLASFKAHLSVHLEEEIVLCYKCGEAFFSLNQLEEHLSTHDIRPKRKECGVLTQLKPPDLRCPICKFTFPTDVTLKKHLAIHNRVKKQTVTKPRPKFVDRSRYPKVCSVCGKGFQKPSQLIRHVRTHTGERPFKCTHSGCDSAFKQKGSLLIHMDIHTNLRKYKCELCKKGFVQKSNLRCHMKRVHPPKHATDGPRYHCDECPCVFRKSNSLNAHISKEHMADTILAEDNVKYFEMERLVQQLNDLQKNSIDNDLTSVPELRISLGKSQVIEVEDSDIVQQALKNSGLDQAKEALQSVENLRREIEEHGMDKQSIKIVTVIEKISDKRIRRLPILTRVMGDTKWYMCDFKACTKEFKKPSDLVRHMRVHTQEKPFECSVCSKSFSMKATLLSHMKTHLAEKEYVCQKCGKKCTTASSLKTHSWIHSGIKPYKCPICEKNFRTISQRKTHILSHSQSPYKVHSIKKKSMPLPDIPLQDPILITNEGPVRAMHRYKNVYSSEKGEDRPHQCRFCSAAFKKSSHLKQHERTHTGEKPFSCNFCPKTFSCLSVLKVHKKIHAGSENHKCSQCVKIFSSKGSLLRHLNTHSSIRPYLCPYCHKTFKSSGNCKKHMKTHKVELAMDAIRSAGINLQGDSEQALLTSSCFYSKLSDQSGAARKRDDNNENTSNVATSLVSTEENDQMQGTYTQNLEDGSITLTGFQSKKTTNPSLENLEVFPAGNSVATTRPFPEPPTVAPPVGGQQNLEELTPVHLSSNGIVSKVYLSTQLLEQGGLNETLVLDQETDKIFTYTTADDVAVYDITSQTEAGELVSQQTDSSNLPLNTPTKSTHTLQVLKSRGILAKPRKRSTATQMESTVDAQLKCIRCGTTMTKDQDGSKRCTICVPVKTQSKKSSRGSLKNCNICMLDFATASEMTQHVRNYHKKNSPKKSPQKTWTCPVCKATFATYSLVQKHANSHSTEEVAAAVKKENIIEEGNVDPLKKLEITSCVVDSLLEETENQEHKSFRRTYISDGVSYPHNCATCGKGFRKPSDLTRHIRTHTGEKPYECNLCNKRFAVKSTLLVHQKTHTGRKEFQCKICNMHYSSRGSLKIHQRIHTGAKPLKCSICGMKFRTSGHRKSHVAKHFIAKPPKPPVIPEEGDKELVISDEAPVVIMDSSLLMQPVEISDLEGTSFTFQLPPDAVRDVDTVPLEVEESRRTMICAYPDCSKSFSCRRDLQFHMDTQHNVHYECAECGELFLSQASLQHHVLSDHEENKVVKCSDCQQVFDNRQLFSLHRCSMKTKGGKEGLDEDSEPLMIRDLFLS